jgi:hypothetical protein
VVGLPGSRPGGIPATFPCSAFLTGGGRSTLYTGGASFASGHVRRPDPDRWPYFGLSLKQPLMARSFDDACECLISLTLPSDSSAAPGLRLPGWLHCREGFRPGTVALPPPVQRLLPWNTCRERQDLVRLPMLSSDECDFMSQRTTEVSDCRRQRRWSARDTLELPLGIMRRSGAAVRSTDFVRPSQFRSHFFSGDGALAGQILNSRWALCISSTA